VENLLKIETLGFLQMRDKHKRIFYVYHMCMWSSYVLFYIVKSKKYDFIYFSETVRFVTMKTAALSIFSDVKNGFN